MEKPSIGNILLSALAVVSVLSTPLLAQPRPDFSGTWVMDMGRSETVAQAADASPRGAVILVIAQSADQLTIEKQVDGHAQVVAYSFRDPDVSNKPVGTSGSNETSVQGAFAKWTDRGLETLTNLKINGQTVTQTATFALDATGQMLVETVVVVHHGYESAGGRREPGNRNGLKDIYTRRD